MTQKMERGAECTGVLVLDCRYSSEHSAQEDQRPFEEGVAAVARGAPAAVDHQEEAKPRETSRRSCECARVSEHHAMMGLKSCFPV